MATKRLNAYNDVLNRTPKSVELDGKLSDLFGTLVFHSDVMREYLPSDTYKSMMEAINSGARLDRKLADQVATAMKDWALSKGATHYTHWFQPLTGTTAEKHDAFLKPIGPGRAIERFDGDMLVQQEPDASSFPNGGIRNTFEARGYTAWDPSSPAFIMNDTLCIPTVFVSYTGEALDYKTPLLRALQVVDQAATQVCQYFDRNVTKVHATLGWEQEYFLVDSAYFVARPDLVMTGRTLVGHSPAKGQQLEDHYFGSIPERVMQFMREVEYESHLLGIPVKTRHNEVAPAQFEFAPIFEEANVAVDHNSLFMDLLEKVARRHNFRVLLHEKPFAGINGSGKHNNWSLATNTGTNLLSPGKTPKRNLQFLTFFVNAIVAVNRHADLLRASIASAGNDHRLGANEAPPAIISVFLGQQLSAVLDELEKVESGKLSPEQKTELKLNVVGKIPEILLDNTDRNRTSPFAFTGNKFEFRAVGSAANCAQSMTVLNTIVANQLFEFKKSVDSLIEQGLKKDDALFNVLRDLISTSHKVRFEGDGYSEDWKNEAAKRGLSNLPDTPRALKAYVSESSKALFEKLNILNHIELEARYDILLEDYFKKIQIESRTLGDLVTNHILPTAMNYQAQVAEGALKLKSLYDEKTFAQLAKPQLDLVTELGNRIHILSSEVSAMTEARKVANKIEDPEARAVAYCDSVKPHFETIRYHVDKLELSVDNALWPLPKYREMLYAR